MALALACNYFAFQVELFDSEYEANHPRLAQAPSFSSPSLTWESFDKENASQAFVFDADIQIQFLFQFRFEPLTSLLPHTQYHPVRDKSPPREQE